METTNIFNLIDPNRTQLTTKAFNENIKVQFWQFYYNKYLVDYSSHSFQMDILMQLWFKMNAMQESYDLRFWIVTSVCSIHVEPEWE